VVLGIVGEEELLSEPLNAPALVGTFSRWAERALGLLGHPPCPFPPAEGTLDYGRFAELLVGMLCWESRLGFLLSAEDVEQIVPPSEGLALTEPARRALAYALQEQIVRPNPRGLSQAGPLSRVELAESLFRLVARRGEPPLTSAILVSAEGGMLRLAAGEVEHSLPLAARRFFFRRMGSASYFASSLPLAPGDRLAFHRGAEGVDFLELQSNAASFDRSSSFSQWVVRKTEAQLTAEVNGREPRLGTVLDIRPKRYGRSGRVVELELVGSERSLPLRGLAIRTRLGLRENLFFVDRQLDGNGRVLAWVFSGRGWGHGVGLCQVGAFGMAAMGRSYREILAHYYPTAALESTGLAGARFQTARPLSR
jgi:stage II sporulation protein D